MVDLISLSLLAIVVFALAIALGMIAIPAIVLSALYIIPAAVVFLSLMALFLWLVEVSPILAAIVWFSALVLAVTRLIQQRKKKAMSKLTSTAQ